ncbi:cation:proton antiporter [Deinococcus sp. PESE-13]
MAFPTILAALFTLTALLSYLNARFLRLPPTIGVLLGGLFLAAGVAVLGRLGVQGAQDLPRHIAALPFDRVVISGLLSFLLFASAIQTDVRALLRERGVVLALAVVTTLLTMLLLGAGLYMVMQLFGSPLTWTQALLFGAIVAPTDPVAVTPLLERARVPERLRALIAGESLFNDGVGVAAFTVLSSAALQGSAVRLGELGGLLLREMLGGMALGAALGWLTARLTTSARSQDTAVLLSLALVTGGYALGEALHVSAPVTVAAAGVTLMLLGQLARRRRAASGFPTLSAEARRASLQIRSFWEVTDQVLNAVLFVLLALEVLVLRPRPGLLLAGIVVAMLAIVARGIAVGVPLTLYQWRARRRPELQPFTPYTRRLMTWAGLRGTVALALAFSLPPGELRDTLLFLTYVVVIFSLLVQGLTVPILGRKAAAAAKAAEAQGSVPGASV